MYTYLKYVSITEHWRLLGAFKGIENSKSLKIKILG